MTPSLAAERLVAARRSGVPVPWRDIAPADKAQAFAIQDATLPQLGPVGGWKVGAKGPQAEPICAPLPAAGLLHSGALLAGAGWQLRGIEVELALRVGRDLDPRCEHLALTDLMATFDAVLPVIEVVETRLADWRASDPLAQLADLQSHGALVLGAACAPLPAHLDLRTLEARLAFDGQPQAATRGGNPAADLWRLLGWLVGHCARRGQPLRAGQIVTTGSCTGMLFAPAGSQVQAGLAGIGAVGLRFGN